MTAKPILTKATDGRLLHDIGVGVDIDQSADKLVVTTTQDIPDDYVSALKRMKIDPDHNRMGEFHHFARIPTIHIQEMMKAGIDFNRATVKEICTWLHNKGLDAFIVSNRRLY